MSNGSLIGPSGGWIPGVPVEGVDCTVAGSMDRVLLPVGGGANEGFGATKGVDAGAMDVCRWQDDHHQRQPERFPALACRHHRDLSMQEGK